MLCLWIVPLLLFCLLRPSVLGAAVEASQAAREAHPDPQERMREVVENALHQKAKDQIHWSYRESICKDGRLETREVCETNVGTVERLVAINNQSLSPEQQRREDARIGRLLADPSEILFTLQQAAEFLEKQTSSPRESAANTLNKKLSQ